MKKLLLTMFALVCVSIGAWAGPHDVTQDPNDATKYWIGDNNKNYFTVADGVVTFHVNETKHNGEVEDLINKAWNNISNKFDGATRIKFANDCNITQNDLERFLQGNTYYVDLFDITNGTNAKMTPETIDPIITGAVTKMEEKGWQAKGIILPLNTISGTSTVVKSSDRNNPKPTFTEYAAYYRDNTTQKTATIYAIDTRMAGDNWQNKTNNDEAQRNYETAYTHLFAAHTEVANAQTCIVSTNNKIKNSDQGLNLTKAGYSLPTNATKITIINDEMVYKTSTTRSYLADIIVEGTAGAFAAAVENTNINLTPCEELIFKGTVGATDIAAINEFTGAEGPHVYNLADATGVAKTDLSSITNTKVEYIILPHAMAVEQIEKSCFSQSLTNSETFKAAIAPSADMTKLSAYVNVAGSLAKARCYATGNSADQAGNYKPTKRNLTSVILGGNLNASDISTKQENNKGLQNEYSTITSLDLEKAYFANVNDMRLGNSGQVQVDGQWVTMDGAGFQQSNVLTEVKLPATPDDPNAPRMTEIPEGCLNGIKCLHNLHIPYNYQKIGWIAFWETGINHITTEDANHALIDNGPNTYTLSANINELGKPGQSEGQAVFPGNQFVTDVYCLAMTTPVCYAHTFHANMVYANGGIYDGVYCREKYIKYENGQPHNAVTMLHFPSQESYINAKGNDTDYNDMVAKYTDPTRVYSKKDQTDAVDANGNPLLWPDQGEVKYTRDMALDGYIWTNYQNKKYETGGDGHLETMGSATGAQAAFYPNYVGWHEFVLSMATYVDPNEIVVNEKIIREYQKAGWYTICLPFNLSIKQAREWLGVPKSECNVICKLYDEKGVLIEDDVKSPYMPDIRQLYSVARAKGGTIKDAKGNIINQNMVYLRMTNNLWDGAKAQYLDFNLDASAENVIKYTDAHKNGTTTVDDDYFMIGGRPYIIYVYKRKGEKISRQNIGQLIMTHYADEFDKSASCVQNGLYEQLGTGTLETLRFSKPYENHKVQAQNINPQDPGYMTYKDEGEDKRYFYTMIGQFWKQKLPLYCLYMSKGNWYRNAEDLGYEWDPYKCIIMATVEQADVAHPKSGGYRDNSEGASVYPQPVEGTTDKLVDNFKLQFLDGRNDDDFQNYATSKYVFTFDDEGVTEWDENGVVITAIDKLDGEDLSIRTDNKVYNISGQFVGNSLEGLSRGMYIVNGKKFIVK